ncbi:hypothetical protein ACE5IS_02605 [Leptospira wolffii]|uniref:EpsG family protein n=1 Tax=Leptospira wolffii TaxID=409998 RepID=A0ABV5BKB0_9LEPT
MRKEFKDNIKKILKVIVAAVLFVVAAHNVGRILYHAKFEALHLRTIFFDLSYRDISAAHLFDSFFSPYHLYFLNIQLDGGAFRKYFESITKLSGVLLFVFAYLKFDLKAAIIFGALYLLHPIYLIQSTWIAFPDTYTLLFSILLIIIYLGNWKETFKKIAFLLIVILGLYNHYYQFMFIAGFLTLLYVRDDLKGKYSYLILLLVALLFARYSSIFLFEMKGALVKDYRVGVLASLTWDKMLELNTRNFFGSLFSLFFGLLPFFVWNTVKTKNYIILIFFAICYAITWWTFDTTRVFVHLFFPVWIYTMMEKYSTEDDHRVDFILLAFALIFTYFFDLYYSWNGDLIYLN